MRRVRIGISALAALAMLGAPAAAQQQAPATPQSAFDDAKALGTQRANSDALNLRNGQSQGVVANTIRGFTADPPEKQIYGRQDTAGPTAAMRARCASNPSDPVCSGARVATAQRPASDLTPASPVLAAQEAVRNPTAVLGDIASTYNACSVGGTLTTPAQFERRSCTLDTGAWQSEPCTKTLSVSPVDRYSCNVGSVLASANIGGEMSVVAYCNATGNGRVPFTFNAWGSHGTCSGPLSVTLDLSRPQPQTGGTPQVVGGLQPHWSGYCFPIEVAWEGPGCSNGQCNLTVHFVQTPAIEPGYACTQAGQVRGADISFSGYPPGGSEATCFVPYQDYDAAASAGALEYWGVAGGVAAYWGAVGPATPSGWQWSGGRHYSTALSFAEPTLLPASGDVWTDSCASQEARAPLQAKDGLDTGSTLVKPTVGPIGQSQCVRTRSVCTDGPSTRVIDGVSVRRECWSYSNQFECTTLDASSTCGAAAFAACSPAGDAGCVSVDSAGRCLQATQAVDCKTADAVFSSALNCGDSSYCAGGSCWDSTKTSNTGFAQAVSQLEAHQEAGKDMTVDGSAVQIFKGQDRRCTVGSFGLDNCCSDSALIQQCSQDEQDTYRQKSEGRCHAVGEYCSSRAIFGSCVERTHSACCFSSLLGRVIQEQGRAQLAVDWGDARNPDCRGFTPAELTALDWSRFDLSEFYASIHATPLEQNQVSGDVRGQQTGCYYGKGRC
ncbi:conserved exported hypothetical protein [Rubrivivax sp. A210]|uniref:conjugal transfer protein TraN n=1 Tax=Rubrivivax sp. A210 TaxID=2772301 RepID=UPI00191B5B80|nr:conjugal transfer protein TraN [Rubrivivax sp. A210]CAD5366855.1 conserved exported hypothetical protein [Rubrivivax sp. A210]